jgi:hypothetical protein
MIFETCGGMDAISISIFLALCFARYFSEFGTMMGLDNRSDIPREHRVRRGHPVWLIPGHEERLVCCRQAVFRLRSLIEYIRVAIRVKASILYDLAKSKTRLRLGLSV